MLDVKEVLFKIRIESNKLMNYIAFIIFKANPLHVDNSAGCSLTMVGVIRSAGSTNNIATKQIT